MKTAKTDNLMMLATEGLITTALVCPSLGTQESAACLEHVIYTV